MATLAPILTPTSLAVLGVSSRAESLSGRLLANLFAAGFAGPVFPVNPKARSIRGLRCAPSVSAIGEAVDLAIVMVPRDAVLASIDECVAAGVKGLVVITAGFREGGEDGARAERSVLERVRAAGVRMVGPNCMGLINTDPGVRLDATFSPVAALPGAVAFASHSGALGVAFLELAREAGLGFSQFVSLGNSADVNVCDLLEAWEQDERTRVIMLYLEGLEQPRRFLEIAARLAPTKPIVALKAGRTAAGQKAASSHTGALAAADTAVDAVLKQAGVLRAASLEELFDIARTLAWSPLPSGRRVAVITNAGGPAIAASDAFEAGGLELAGLSESTRATLRAGLPAEASVGNPVDMLPSASPENYRSAVELALADPAVDAVLTITVTPIVVTPEAIGAGIGIAAAGAAKPVLPVFMTDPRFHAGAREIQGLPPTFRMPEAAVRTLSGLVRAGELGRRRRGHGHGRPALAAPSRRGYLPAAEAFALLERAGVAVAPFREVPDAASVAAAAEEIGYPVVLKAGGEGLVHKSELGAVVVGLRDRQELERALSAMRERLAAAGVRASSFLLQRMVAGGREVILGLLRDPGAGPLVMCGLGGIAVEVLRDVAFRPAPLTAADAEEMIAELRGAALLGPFRGRPPADRGALVQAIVALGDLAAGAPWLAECDVNPLLVLDDGRGCVAVDVRVRVDAPLEVEVPAH